MSYERYTDDAVTKNFELATIRIKCSENLGIIIDHPRLKHYIEFEFLNLYVGDAGVPMRNYIHRDVDVCLRMKDLFGDKDKSEHFSKGLANVVYRIVDSMKYHINDYSEEYHSFYVLCHGHYNIGRVIYQLLNHFLLTETLMNKFMHSVLVIQNKETMRRTAFVESAYPRDGSGTNLEFFRQLVDERRMF